MDKINKVGHRYSIDQFHLIPKTSDIFTGRLLRKTASIPKGRLLYYQTATEVSRNPGQIEMVKRIDPDLSDNLADLTHLIRSIQRIEGNPDCFGTADGDCDRLDCSWHEYCLKETPKDSV